MRCKYCFPRNQGDCLAEKSIWNRTFKVFGNPFEIDLSVVTNKKLLGFSIENTDVDIKINYCPMCGRKL